MVSYNFVLIYTSWCYQTVYVLLKHLLSLITSYETIFEADYFYQMQHIIIFSGPGLVKRFRGDLQAKFSELFDDDTIPEYIYHCNAQKPRYEASNRKNPKPFDHPKKKCCNRH